MNKAFLLVVMLVSVSFIGCIEDSSDSVVDETTENGGSGDETITPVGNNDTTNIAPYVDAGVWDKDNFQIYFDEIEEAAYIGVFVNWATKDFDGNIDSAGFDLDLDMTIDVPVENDFGVLLNQTGNSYNQTLMLDNDNWEYNVFNGTDGYCGFIFHYTFAFIAVDNAGASAMELVQFVMPEVLGSGDIRDVLDDEAGLFGITEDDLEALDNTGCGNSGNNSGLPIATFFVSEDSANVYHIDVIKVSRQVSLENFSFFLKDGSGSTYVGGNGFGEIAMQNQGGIEVGIDMNYNGNDSGLTSRAGNVSNDDGSMFPVHFSDNDLDGLLSSGDKFMVYGPNAGPAQDGWKLDIQYDPTGDIIGSAKLL